MNIQTGDALALVDLEIKCRIERVVLSSERPLRSQSQKVWSDPEEPYELVLEDQDDRVIYQMPLKNADMVDLHELSQILNSLNDYLKHQRVKIQRDSSSA